MKKVIFFSILFFLISVCCFADQAAWVQKSEAYKAAGMINPGDILREYCPPKGDTTWTDITVKQLEVKTIANQPYYEVVVNNEGIDLAYFYIEKESKWINLAHAAGLKVSDVPESLPEKSGSAPKKRIHPIDKKLDECIAKDSSTVGMTECYDEAYKEWDAELNKVYKSLRSAMGKDQKKALKTAQLEWIKYRDLEFKLIESIYSSLEGTMYIPMRVADRVNIVEKRTLELESYLDLLKSH